LIVKKLIHLNYT